MHLLCISLKSKEQKESEQFLIVTSAVQVSCTGIVSRIGSVRPNSCTASTYTHDHMQSLINACLGETSPDNDLVRWMLLLRSLGYCAEAVGGTAERLLVARQSIIPPKCAPVMALELGDPHGFIADAVYTDDVTDAQLTTDMYDVAANCVAVAFDLREAPPLTLWGAFVSTIASLFGTITFKWIPEETAESCPHVTFCTPNWRLELGMVTAHGQRRRRGTPGVVETQSSVTVKLVSWSPTMTLQVFQRVFAAVEELFVIRFPGTLLCCTMSEAYNALPVLSPNRIKVFPTRLNLSATTMVHHLTDAVYFGSGLVSFLAGERSAGGQTPRLISTQAALAPYVQCPAAQISDACATVRVSVFFIVERYVYVQFNSYRGDGLH